MTYRLPSVAQMVNRANDGHHKALRRIADETELLWAGAGMGEVRGMRIVLSTLEGSWEAITTDGEPRTPECRYVLTDRGVDLLLALDRRADKAGERARLARLAALIDA